MATSYRRWKAPGDGPHRGPAERCCAGQDLNDRGGPGRRRLGESVEQRYNPLIRTLTGLPFPVIARVNGVAAGAGANIALACDIVIAARSAKFIQSFASIGLIPDSGGTWVLPRLVGQARALGLALTAEPLPAEKAAEWGLIWKAVDDDRLDEEVDALAARFAGAPTKGLGPGSGRDPRRAPQLDEEDRPPGESMREPASEIREGVAGSWRNGNRISLGRSHRHPQQSP